MPEKKLEVVKEKLQEELREFGEIAFYLAICFSLLATIKSLILIQSGVHDFLHGYTVSIIEALALGKIVLLCKNVPFLKNTIDRRPVVISALAKSAVLTVIVFFGGQLEERIFAHHVAEATLKQKLIVDCTHVFCLFLVFYAMFVVRELSAALGPGQLSKLLFSPRKSVEKA